MRFMAPGSASLAVFAALAISTSPLAIPVAMAGGSVDVGPSPGAEPAETQPTREPAGDDLREVAKRAFDEGLAAVASGEFELAVTNFERAYGLRPHPVTLFNLALALEKAGRLPEAWELFDDIIDTVESNAERREIRRHMRTIEGKIAIVEIDAQPRQRLCIDGLDMPKGETSDYRLAIEPGPHAMLLDAHAFEVEFEPGDRRVLLLDRVEKLVPSQPRSVLAPAMVGTAIGTGALALGLGISAATVTDDRTQVGLAVGAATGAGLAVAASVVVLLLETRVIVDPTRAEKKPSAGGDRSTRSTRSSETTCPGSPELERRLDLRIGPTPGQAPALAVAPTLRVHPARAVWAAAETSSDADAFPHPHAIQPPRGRD
jgi:hypothetical protein